MPRFFRWLALFAPLALSACGSPTVMEIDHYKTPCYGVSRYLCTRARDQGAANFGLMYDGIEGFSFQWGHTYVLEVDVDTVDNPPEDGSSVSYTLMSVISDTPVSPETTFVIRVDGTSDDLGYLPDLTFDQNGGGTLLSAVAFTCADADVCAAASQVEDTGGIANLTFGYPDPVGEPIVLLAVEPN